MKRIQLPDRFYLLVLALATFFLLTLLVVKFFIIQVFDQDYWSRLARRQHYFTVQESFIRGSFFSSDAPREHHPKGSQQLVVDIEKFHLFADPLSIPEELRTEIVETLVDKLDLDFEGKAKVEKHLSIRSRNRRLASWLDAEQKEGLQKWWKSFAKTNQLARNAIYFLPDYQRSYPYGKLLGQVLQTVQLERDEKSGEAYPTGGLELQFNHLLQGKKGQRRLMRSPRNAFEIGEEIERPLNGADIYLTIDQTIQAIVEEEIAKAVKKWKAKGGWAVMMEPKTGAILALGQYPFFYPAQYRDFYNDPDKRDHSRIKAITDAPEPGSVMKPITIAIALMANDELVKRGEKPLFSPDEKMATLDGKFPGRSRPIKDTSKHPYLNMQMAIQKSSNIYVGRLVQRIIDRLGTKWYRNALTEYFGFGSKTGIELAGESSGLVPRPGRFHPNGALEWSVPTPFSIAMGHNIQMTSLQLLRAYSVIANRGTLVNPTLIRKIVRKNASGEEELLYDFDEKLQTNPFRQVASSSIIDQVVDTMKYVTKPGGGGWRADIPGYTEAGKTGTPEKVVGGVYSRKDHQMSLFIGMAPIDNPAFVLLVILDEPDPTYVPGAGRGYFGGVGAAPVFREIGKRTLGYLGIPSDDPGGYPKGDPRYEPETAHWIKESEQLQKLYKEWNDEIKKTN